MACSYIFTKKALESLGFEVTIVHTKAEVIRRIKNNEKYDIIFSNNVYDDGSGPQCFEELKKIEGFNTPVVIHTVTKNAKFHFVVELGFDGYIEKPVTQSKLIPVLEKLLQGGNNFSRTGINVYDDGSGPQCFEELKKIEGFNTPVVIHTVTKNAKFHFVVELGFDGYIEKPVTQSKLIPVLEKLLQGGNNETKNI